MIPSALQIFYHLGMLLIAVSQLCKTLDNSYVVQVKPDGVCYRFSRDPNSNTYLCVLDTMLSEPRLSMVVTVSDKMKMYS